MWLYDVCMETQLSTARRATDQGKRRRVIRGLSLQPEHERAIRSIAVEQGHGNVSRIVQDLIEAEMRSRIGKDWRGQFSDDAGVPEEQVA